MSPPCSIFLYFHYAFHLFSFLLISFWRSVRFGVTASRLSTCLLWNKTPTTQFVLYYRHPSSSNYIPHRLYAIVVPLRGRGICDATRGCVCRALVSQSRYVQQDSERNKQRVSENDYGSHDENRRWRSEHRDIEACVVHGKNRVMLAWGNFT